MKTLFLAFSHKRFFRVILTVVFTIFFKVILPIFITIKTFSKFLSFNCYFIAETIENECITFEIYLDARERVIFSLYSITYRLSKK